MFTSGNLSVVLGFKEDLGKKIERSGRKRKTTMVASYLPPNIIQDILSRLDVKALLRFKCVCKSWNFMISSPSFQDIHRRKSQQNLRFLLRNLVPFYDQNEEGNRWLTYQFLTVDDLGNQHDIFNARANEPIKLVLPTLCGLVCFATNTRIYVCKPSLRQVIALPSLPYRQHTPISGFGFGYSSGFVKTYKVVRLVHRIIMPSTHKVECSVFTLPGLAGVSAGGNSWKLVNEGCPYLVEQFSYPVFVEETIYWKINRGRYRSLMRRNDYVVSFNLKEERFSTITHPANLQNTPQCSTQLADLGGMLGMVEMSLSDIMIWMLKDQGSSLWESRWFISLAGINRSLVGEVKCFINGEIVISSFTNAVLFCDTKNNRFRFRQVLVPDSAFELGMYWDTF